MLLPVAIAVGLSTSFACHSKVVIPNAVMGAVMGAELSALVYGVLAGVVTPLENVANIFPAHMENRYLLFVTAFLAIGIVDLIQAARTPSREHDKANAVVT